MLHYVSIALAGAIPLCLYVYSKYISEKPRVYVKFGTDLYTRVHRHLELINQEYRPSWWCPFGTMMTIVRQLFRSCPRLPFEREVLTLSDGGCVALDWMKPEGTDDKTPICIFLPGITGTTYESAYILHCVMEANDQNWRSVVVNPRGLGGVPLLTKQTYNAAYAGDITQVLQIITDRFPDAKKIACGFSMGGMIIGNYVSRRTKENANIDGVMIISSPFDPHVSSQSLETPIPRFLFNGHLAKCLVDIIAPFREMFEDMVDFEKVLASKTIREFDTHFTTPVFGYKTCVDYYEDASMSTKIHSSPVPTVCLNSVDDVFAPIESLPLDKINKSENVVAIVTSHGGHTAFMEGSNPNQRGYVEKLLAQWGKMIFNDLH